MAAMEFLLRTAQVDTLLQGAPDRSALLGMLGALDVHVTSVRLGSQVGDVPNRIWEFPSMGLPPNDPKN